MAKKRKGLTDEQRAFLVRELACFSTPAEAVDLLRETYGVEITPQSAEFYDPTKKASKSLSQRWRDQFEDDRKAFIDDVTTNIPEAHKSMRIKQLALASRMMKKRGNWVGMADMLEKIAKEVGNVHSNRHKLEHTGKDGGAIQFQDVDAMTDDQIDAELRQLLGQERSADIHPAPESEQ